MFYVRAEPHFNIAMFMEYLLRKNWLWLLLWNVFMIVFFLGAIKLDYIDFSIEKQSDSCDAFAPLRNLLMRAIFWKKRVQKV